MKYNIFFFVAFICIFLPTTSHAGDFVNLVGIPGLSGDPTAGGLNDYINALYRLSISIAALLAVIKIVIAGAKYMLSDIVTHKEDAKKDIQGALVGLLIVIGAIIILNTVNTDLTNLDLTIATTTVNNQGPTIQELIARQQQQIENSITADQSELQEVSCPYYTVLGLGNSPRCTRECREMRGRYNSAVFDSCTISTSLAATCDPDTNVICCETVNGADWDEGDNETGTCSGLEQGKVDRARECGEGGRIWDAAGNYCRTASCNINTDTNCCSVANGTIVNGVCQTTGGTITDEQVCINRGAGWAFIGGTCQQQNVEQFEFRDVPADIASNINAAYQYCINQGEGWGFNENAQPPRCQRFNSN